MAKQEAGLVLKAEDAAKFIADINKSGQATVSFGKQVQDTAKQVNTSFGAGVVDTQSLYTNLDKLSKEGYAAVDARAKELMATQAGAITTNQAYAQALQEVTASSTDIGKSIQDTTDATKDADKAAQDLARSMTVVGVALAAAGAAGTKFLLGISLQASRIEELAVLLEVTRQNAIYLAEAEGDVARAASLTSEAVQAQVQGIRDLHLSGEVANRTVATLIRYNLDWTKATELAALAQNAATFAAQDSSQAVEGLIHGITTLQPRVLRTYGLMINLNEAYREYAAANNVAVKDMTVLERQQAALNKVLSLAPSIAGAYEAAMGTAAKQIRSLKTDVVNLSEAFGEEFTPVLDAATRGVRSILHGLTELPDPLQAFIVYATGAGSALASITGSAALLIPRLPKLVSGFRALSSAVGLSTGALAGLALGIPVAIGVVAALIEMDRAHREEAAQIATTAETYPEYIRALEIAGEESYILTEQLWKQVEAQEAANQAAYAARILEEQRDMYTRLDQAIRRFGGSLDKVLEHWAASLPLLSEFQLALMADKEAMYNMAIRLNASEEEAQDWANAVSLMARAELAHQEQTEELIKQQEALADLRRRMIEGSDDEEAAMTRLTTAIDGYSDAVKEAIRADLDWWQSGQDAADDEALRDFEQKRIEETQKAADKIVSIEQKAADARRQANVKLQDALEDLEIKHALTVVEIYDDLAEIDAELQQAILENNEKRIELQIDLEQRLEDIRIELARKQEDIERERLQDLEDLQREAAQKREDAARDLAQDLEDMEREHQENLADITRGRQEALLDLEEEYQRRLYDIENAGQQRLLELQQSYAEKDSDARLKYARRALELIEQQNIAISDEMRQAIIDMFRTGAGPEDLLDFLPQDVALLFRDLLKELEGLNEDLLWDQLDLSDDIQKDQEKRKEDLEKWLADEQAAIEEAHQKRLAAEQERIEREREERQRDYNDKLESLRRAQEREREEIERARQRKLEDLQRWNEREREEARRNYQQRLEDYERQLVAESEKNREQLQQRLEDEQRNYDARRDELERQHARRLRDIDDNEKAERQEIQTSLDLKLQAYVDGYEGIGFAARAGMQQMIDDARVILPDLVEEHRKTIREIQQAWADAGMLGESPAPWWKEMAQSWSEGLQVGFEDDALWSNIVSSISGLQSQIGSIGQQVTMPVGMGAGGTSYSTSNQLNVTAQYQHQSEASLRDDLALYDNMLRAWGR